MRPRSGKCAAADHVGAHTDTTTAAASTASAATTRPTSRRPPGHRRGATDSPEPSTDSRPDSPPTDSRNSDVSSRGSTFGLTLGIGQRMHASLRYAKSPQLGRS
ncbi:hypothetical protein [Streptomyces sp. NPDC051364]|uniref:hypothetical protein n=1 Tax=Streptomyces sp. NPDC051364 TaxID=3155799 RepID=UPI00341C463C